MITVQNLTKSFGQVKALQDLSFTVQPGEVVGFLGPNGAGKSTTMRIITGFISPDSGTVTIDDIPVAERTTEIQRKIGYLPENNPLYKDMLVSELLALSADLKNIPKAKRREAFDFVVNAVGIADVFYRPIRELSKGYKQRIGIAVALLHQPTIIIMDEPTEGLDPNQRSEIRALIRTLAKDHTIIVSTHVMQEASAVCNRLLIINKGKLVADGTPDELTRKAQHERTLILEVQGSNVETELKALPGITHVDLTAVGSNRLLARLMLEGEAAIQPAISSLAHRHQWIIWKLAEEEHSLEDVFHALTHEQPKEKENKTV